MGKNRKKKHQSRKPKLKQKKPAGKKRAESKEKRQKKQRFINGSISIASKGYGFVSAENKKELKEDVFIPKKYLKGAVDGDSVKVQLADIFSSKGPEGKIVKILKRKHTCLVGTVVFAGKSSKAGQTVYTVFIPLLGRHKTARISSSTNLKKGDRITLKVLRWNAEDEPLEGSFQQFIGNIDDASADVKAAILEYGLADKFSEKAVEEALSFNEEKIEQELKKRRDYTDLNTITIDPETAKDFDDALSIKEDEKGHFHLGVHIADAAHFVKLSSELDKEALKRGNSTYFPGFCLPMLPKELSNGLCSLKPGVKRLSISVIMEFDKDAELLNYRINRAVIKNKKRFSYEEALAVLQKKISSPFSSQLEKMQNLCLLLKKKRKERGSVELSLPSPEIIVDEQGEPENIRLVEYDISHQMVEEFMLKANEIVAEHLKKRGKELIYRVHEQPEKDALQSFFELAQSLGFSLPPNPGEKDIQKLFLKAQDSPLLTQLSIGYIRSMKLAAYSPENLGHYGLALERYCHFTSPIRRYSDLVAQRLLFDEEGQTDLNAISQICSSAERKSFKAESSVVNLKKLRLLKQWQKKQPHKIYKAIVSKVKPYFLVFEVAEIYLEGSLHLSEIGDDFYIFDPFEEKLIGDYSGRSFAHGDRLKVKLNNISLVFLEAQWQVLQ